MNGYTCKNCRYINFIPSSKIIEKGIKKDKNYLDLYCVKCNSQETVYFEIDIRIKGKDKEN